MLKLCCGLLTFIALTTNAFADDAVRARLDAMKPKDFPTQPLEFIVVYPAGGGMDVIARQVAPARLKK